MTVRRLPGILLLTGAALVVIAACWLAACVLLYRILTPGVRKSQQNRIRDWHAGRSQSALSQRQNFGPTLEAHDIRAELKDGANFRLNALLWRWMSGRACYIALAVSRPHFLAAALSHQHSFTSGGSDDSLEASHISDLFLVNLTISISATVKSVF